MWLLCISSLGIINRIIFIFQLLSFFLYRSMLPDVVDLASLKTGIRREEFFYSFFVFGNKFSSGITLALSTGLYR